MMGKSLLQYHYMALIQKQAVRNYWDTVRPSGIDIAYCAVVVLVGLFVIMLPTVFDTYNLLGAREILESGFGDFVGKILASIDKLSFTNSVVTFMFWGVVGMVVYALVSSLLRALQRAESERELASDEYVHPAVFSRATFWREELIESAVTFASFVLFGVVTIVVLLQLLPTTTIHLRSVVATSGTEDIVPALAATALLFVGTCLVMLAYKLWRHRKVLFEEIQ